MGSVIIKTSPMISRLMAIFIIRRRNVIKKIIWDEMKREYLEEQAAKEAAAKAAFEANYKNCPEGLQSAQELAAAVAKSRKEKHQKRASEAKNSGPAQTALEASRRMLIKKVDEHVHESSLFNQLGSIHHIASVPSLLMGINVISLQRLSSKINSDVLEKLFDDSVASENPNKQRTEYHSDNDDKLPNNEKREHELGDLVPECEFDTRKILGKRVRMV